MGVCMEGDAWKHHSHALDRGLAGRLRHAVQIGGMEFEWTELWIDGEVGETGRERIGVIAAVIGSGMRGRCHGRMSINLKGENVWIRVSAPIQRTVAQCRHTHAYASTCAWPPTATGRRSVPHHAVDCARRFDGRTDQHLGA